MRTGTEIVEILEDYLKNKKISLRQFSSAVDIPHSTIISWKKKNTLPSIEFISKIASSMNVSLEWLVNGEQDFEEKESSFGPYSRANVRSRIYKRLIEKFHITENADNLKQLHHDYFNPGYVSYDYLLNWSKGRNEIDYTIFISWANCLDTTVQYLLTGEQESAPAYFDKHTYDVAMKNQNDLFCLDNLTGDRKQAAHTMLNQFMKLEHLEYVEKNEKDSK